MKTFYEYLNEYGRDLFKPRTHQHPVDAVADEFIDTLPSKFSKNPEAFLKFLKIPRELLKSYVRSVLKNDKVKYNELKIKLFLAAKSVSLVKIIDSSLTQHKEELENDKSWYKKGGGTAFGQ